jgi:hypothetical protein
VTKPPEGTPISRALDLKRSVQQASEAATGAAPTNRNDGYTHPFGQAPRNEAERQQQIRESTAISRTEAENQKLFNQNIRDQNGGNHPSLDKSTYRPPTLGHYDPRSQQFVADRQQPARDPNQVPGAPHPTDFPTYQQELKKQFEDNGDATVPGDPADIKIRPITDDDDGPGYAGGGHIRGAGTGTSDSIPAMLSDGEYVVKADAVKKMGVDTLDAINAGHYADGGAVDYPRQVEVNGAYYYPTSLQDYQNIMGQAQGGQARAEAEEKYQRSHKKKSLFVGSYDSHDMANYQFAQDRDESYTGGFGLATGGLVGSSPSHSRLRSIINGFANGGIIDVPHLAIGGMPDLSGPTFPENSSVFNNGPKGDSAGAPHHTVDLRTDHGTFKMMSPEQTVKQLKAAAGNARKFSTGSKPSWYGGGNG